MPSTAAAPERELPPFQSLPPEQRARVFGVDYAIVPQSDGADFWVSRPAWHWLDYLQPGRWWDRDNLAVRGERLAGSTGTVYRARSAPPGRVPRDLVVKFPALRRTSRSSFPTTSSTPCRAPRWPTHAFWPLSPSSDFSTNCAATSSTTDPTA